MLIAATFTGMLVFMLGTFIVSGSPHPNSDPVSIGEALSLTQLAPGEKVLIVYISCGCFHYRERLYEIEGASLRFAAQPLHLDTSGDGDQETTTVIGRLGDGEAIGLDAYLCYLRRGFRGGCTTTDRVVVGYYRGGKKIGEESFLDRTCADFQPTNASTLELECPAEFPAIIYRAVITPWQIERRLKRPLESSARL